MNRLTQMVLVASLCGAALLGASARAQIATGGNANGGPPAPIDVTADQLEMVDSQHLAIWKGNVEAVQNGNRLVSDVLNVYFVGNGQQSKGPAKTTTIAKPGQPGSQQASIGSNWGAVQRMVADGHVYFVGQNQTARGEHAIYDLDPDTITITGDVVVVQGDNVVKGDKLVIQVKTGHADIISNATGRNKPERVRGVFYNNNTQGGAPSGQTASPAAPKS